MKTTQEYLNSIHRFGRISALGAIIVMMGIPIIMSLYTGLFPGVGTIIKASIGLLAIFIPITITEVLSYTPVLGSSIYLTLITGNVMNLKLPVAMNGIKVLNVEPGTEKSDVISAISVATSSIVTISVMALGAFLMVPLKPLLTTAAMQTASHYILPSLFGAFSLSLISPQLGGGISAKGRLKGGIITLLLVIVLYLLSPMLVSQLQGVIILIALPVTFFTTKYLFKKGKIEVILPEDQQAA